MRSKSKKYDRTRIEEVRGRARIEAVIEAELGQRRDAAGKVLCPFHDDKNPSLHIYSDDDPHYFCFVCEENGDVFEFIRKRRGVDFPEAIRIVDEMSGAYTPVGVPSVAEPVVAIEEERRISVLDATADFYAKSLTPEAVAYLNSRGLSGQTIKEFRFGYGASGLRECLLAQNFTEDEGLAAHVLKRNKFGGVSEPFLGLVLIPYRRRERTIYLVGRMMKEPEPEDKGKRYRNLSDAKPGFFNEDVLDRADLAEVWIVEGAFDCLAATQAGFPCVAIGGKDPKDEWIKRLPKNIAIKLCLDGDEPGRQGVAKAVGKLTEAGRSGVVVNLPDGKDPNEYLAEPAGAVELLRLAKAGAPFRPSSKKSPAPDSAQEPEQTSFMDLGAFGLAEMLYDHEARTTQFAHYHDRTVEYTAEISLPNGRLIQPFRPDSMMERRVLRFPSLAEEYGSDAQLLADVQTFIARFVGVSKFYEAVAAHYVLLTWVYDCFPVVPYLRVRGDFGTGKTRFQEVVGALTYKTITCSGATTVAPLFRMIDRYRGTVVIDEADFRFSDAAADMIKILNCGYKRGGFVLRCQAETFEPVAFDVYGPKILGTRRSFDDQALESRCLTEEMDGSYREGIPKHLPPSFELEAQRLRNQLLLWRFRHYGKRELDARLEIPGIEPRLNEIALPILTVIESPSVRADLQRQFTQYNRQLIQERGMSKEGRVLEVICELYPLHKANGTDLTMKIIADHLTLTENPDAYSSAAQEYHRDRPKRIISDPNDNAKIMALFKKRTPKQFSAHTIGRIVSSDLKLEKTKTRNGYSIRISAENERALKRLREKFGIDSDSLVPESSETESVLEPEIVAASGPWADGDQL